MARPLTAGCPSAHREPGGRIYWRGWTSFLSEIRPRGAAPAVPLKSRAEQPYGIVWLNPFSTEEWTLRWTPKRRVGESHSQAGLGVCFGIHFSTKREIWWISETLEAFAVSV